MAQAASKEEVTFEQSLDRVMALAKGILLNKREQRGTANISRQGLIGVVTRISEDKLERVKRFAEDQYLRTLCERRQLPDVVKPFTPEDLIGVTDDLVDIANYCFISVLLLSNEWELP